MTRLPCPPSPPLLLELDAAMPGKWARFTPGLVGPADPRPGRDLKTLLDDAMLSQLLTQARTGATPDIRAVVSVWALGCFETVLPALLAAIILLRRVPDLVEGQVTFILAPAGQVAALKVSQDSVAASNDHLIQLVTDFLACFIAHVASRSAVTERVLWSNAGHIFEAFLGMLASRGAGQPSLADARGLLAKPALRDGTRNPLFQPVRYVGGQRLRRVCCLRYLVQDWRICAICPLAPDHPQRQRRDPSRVGNKPAGQPA